MNSKTLKLETSMTKMILTKFSIIKNRMIVILYRKAVQTLVKVIKKFVAEIK
jgi:hypothetical protein